MKRLVIVVVFGAGCHLLYQPSSSSPVDAVDETSDGETQNDASSCSCSSDRTTLVCAGQDPRECPHRCIGLEGNAQCAPFTPHNFASWAWVESVPSGTTVIDGGLQTFDTSSTTMPLPPGAADVMFRSHVVAGREHLVMLVDNLTISATKLLVVGTRPLIILARGNVTVASDSKFDASSIDDVLGAGAKPRARNGEGGKGCSGGEGGNNMNRPAQGGGFAATGGFGSSMCNLDLTMGLEPGSGGGSSDNFAAFGGAGGGAIQISALGTIRIDGKIRAHGGGGGGGAKAVSDGVTAGGGGGSGGAIVLQANRFEGMGGVFANGGAGGSCGGLLGAGQNGANGGDSVEQQPSADGGAGGARIKPAGANGTACEGALGGGGGSAGAIRVDSVTNSQSEIDNLTMNWSPAPSIHLAQPGGGH